MIGMYTVKAEVSRRGMSARLLQICIAAALIAVSAGCAGSSSSVRDTGPRLVQNVTLPPPTTPWQTAPPVSFVTLTPAVLPVQPVEASTPIQVVTIDSGFLFITPTLPPSKTPTITPTHSRTPTSTPVSAPVLIPTVSLLLPTSVVATDPPPFISLPPVNQPFVTIQPVPMCTTNWFFFSPRPLTCPLNPPLISAAAALRFELGYMIWVQEQNAVYVLYDDTALPAWEVFPDRFEEGMPERDDTIVAPETLWQPKRGFGLVWRTYDSVRRRLGWALRADEEGFTTQVQVGEDGTVYVADPQGGVFALIPAGTDWRRYRGDAGS